MKKLICALLALTLVLGLVGCGETGSHANPSGDSTRPVISSPEKPDASGAPEQPEETPVDQENPEEPETPAFKGEIYADAVLLKFSGLADGHTVEVYDRDGDILALQFDSVKYGELFNYMMEGEQFWAMLECIEGSGYQSWKLSEYLGTPMEGVLLVDAGGVGALDEARWDISYDMGKDANTSILLCAMEAWKDAELWTLRFHDNGEFEKDKRLVREAGIEQYMTWGMDVYIPETIPNLLVEYTLPNGERVQWIVASDMSGIHLPVCLVSADGRLGSGVDDGSPYADAVAVVYIGLGDSHSVEVQLADGSHPVLQFNSSVYGNIFNSHVEGDVIYLAFEDTRLEQDFTYLEVTGYYGPAYDGVMLVDGGDGGAIDVLFAGEEGNTQTFGLWVWEDISNIRLYPLEYQNDGSLKRGTISASHGKLAPGSLIGFDLAIEPYYPNWLLCYERSDGSEVKYFIGPPEEELYLPVCLSPAGSRLVE